LRVLDGVFTRDSQAEGQAGLGGAVWDVTVWKKGYKTEWKLI
jgi:hypothetical protein